VAVSSLLAIALFASTTDQSAIERLHRAREVPKELYYLAQRPSGIMFCDQRLKARQTRRFEERYGLRLKRLIAAEEAKDGLGWAPDDIVMLTCEATSKRAADKMLSGFEIDLRRFESRYGLSAEVR
jgi:hypothetical protein